MQTQVTGALDAITLFKAADTDQLLHQQETRAMFDYLDLIDILNAENFGLKESEIPEPMDNWSIEDFKDFIPSER